MRLIVADDADDAARLAAQELARACQDAIAERGRALVAVSGGSTPWGMLREFGVNALLPWPAVHVAQVDERFVPAGDPRSNGARLDEILVQHGPLPSSNLLTVPVDAPTPEDAAQRYTCCLHRRLGEPLTFDLLQLGLGADGHTASLVPGDTALDETARDVATTTQAYQDTRRITLTYPVVNRARERLWLVTGAAKARALASLLDGGGSAPASRVSREHATVIADRAALEGRTAGISPP